MVENKKDIIEKKVKKESIKKESVKKIKSVEEVNKETISNVPIDNKKSTIVDNKEEDIIKVDNKDSKNKKKIEQKDSAIVNGYSVKISPKQSKYICRMISRKSITRAKEMLENVIKGKLPVKMVMLEVPHQKGKGISGAKYPKEAAKAILLLVKQLEANSIVNGIESPLIKIAMSNRASEPAKRGGRHGKRTHIYLEAISKNKLKKAKNN